MTLIKSQQYSQNIKVHMQQENYDFLQNLTNRSDLDRYGDNKHLLYSLQLKYSIEDIHSVASIALVDGPNDKKQICYT